MNLPILLFRVGLLSPVDSTLSLADSALSQAGSPQAGSSQASQEEHTLSLAESVLSQAGSSQASSEDSTLSLAESALSQAGSSQASQEEHALSPAESVLSQAGSSHTSSEENTLSPESELSQGGSPSSPEDSTLQAESTTAPQAARHLARLRARQAGNTSRDSSKVSQQNMPVPQGVPPRTMLPKRQGPSPVGTTPHRVLSPQRNLTQSR